MHAVIPPQAYNSTLAPVELCTALFHATLQPVLVVLNGSTAF